MKALLTVCLTLLSLALYAQRDSVDVWISKVDNAGIQGTCHYAWVIAPRIDVTEVDKLIHSGKGIRATLINMVTDQDKGVVAHYILSNLYHQTNYSILRTHTVSQAMTYFYNGLVITETAGGMKAEENALKICQRRWLAIATD